MFFLYCGGWGRLCNETDIIMLLFLLSEKTDLVVFVTLHKKHMVFIPDHKCQCLTIDLWSWYTLCNRLRIFTLFSCGKWWILNTHNFALHQNFRSRHFSMIEWLYSCDLQFCLLPQNVRGSRWRRTTTRWRCWRNRQTNLRKSERTGSNMR